MIYGKVGILPLQVSVDKQLIAYLFRALNKDVHTFAYYGGYESILFISQICK